MRNLKKVLSLTLALVMMLGMMTFAGAAETTKITSKDLTDMKDVVNKEQVSLLVDLGIINGIKQADGTYKYAPKDSIERGAYAKMIYAVMMASNNADVYKGVNTGLKDIKGHWAEGFIGYCVSTKIAAGNGNGTFAPNANISVVAGAKMLLTALGYDAKASGYENDALWSINIMRDAQAAGLLDNVAQAAGDTMTRDTAAQLIFNALFANTVTPKFAYDMGVKYLDEYRLGKTLGEQVYGLVKVAAVVDTVSSGKANITANVIANGVTSVTVSGKPITGVLAASPDMAGSQATLYVKGILTGAALNIDKVYSTVLTANASTVLATIYGYDKTGTDALTELLVNASTKVATKEVGLDETAHTTSALTYYYNGAKMTADAANGSAVDTNGDAMALVGKRGVVVEFKNVNGVAGVDTVVITEKKVVTLAAAPVVGTDSKGDAVVSISSLGLSKVAADTVVGYEGLAKDDVVLYVTAGGVTYLEKAASVAGKATGLHSTKGMLLNGTYYLTSALAGTVNAWVNDYTGEYTFYLDNGKNIVKAVKTAGETTSNYAMVLEATWVTGTGEIGKSQFAQAKLLFADGTTEIVTVAKVGGDAPASKKLVMVKDKFYTYTINDDKAYELSTALTSADAASVNITKGAAKFDGTTVGNANTVFLVKSGTDPFTYTTYKGIANVPSMTLSDVNKGVVVTKDAVATHVFLDISDGTLAGGSGDIVYLTSTANSYIPKVGDVPAHYVYDAIVNGVKTTIKLKSSTVADDNNDGTAGDNVAAKVLYEVKGSDANGIASKLDKKTLETGISVSGGTLVSSTTVATVDAGTAIFYINSDGEVNALTADTIVNDKTDEVFVIAKDGLAEKVFIMQTKSDLKAISEVTYTINGGAAVTETIAATGDITTAASTDAGKTIVITGVTTSPEATWAVSGTCVVVANAGPVVAANQIVITVTPEDGSASATFTISFKAKA